MSPSCTAGLSGVGLGSNSNANVFQRDLVRGLTTGRLGTTTLPPVTAYFTGVDLHHDDVELGPLPKLEVRTSPGKGLGLFAVDDIPAYTRILEDFALLSLAAGEDIPELWGKYLALPHEERLAFDSLGFSSNQQQKENFLVSKLEERGYDGQVATKMVRVQSRFMANAFKEENDKWRATLFLTVARINHSCTPNAQTHYRPTSGAKVLYSLRAIKAGEEIEISYFGIHLPYAERQNRVKSWGFTCTCPACSARSNEHERALNIIRLNLEDDGSLARLGVKGMDVRSAIDIAMDPKHPWLVAALPSLFYTLELRLAQKGASREERVDALENALMWECRITGADSHISRSRRQQLEQWKRDLGRPLVVRKVLS